MPEPQRSRNLERAERKFDIMQALGTDLCWYAATPRRRRSTTSPARRADLAEMAERARPRAACASASRRWPGAGTSTDGVTPGTSCGRPTIRRSASSWTASIPFRSATTLPASLTCPPKRSSSCSLPTRRAWRWTCCPGAATSAIFPARASCRSRDFLRDVLAAGYRGPLSLEIFNDEFRAAPARLIARDGTALAAAGGGRSRATSVLPPAPHIRRHRIHRIRGGRRGRASAGRASARAGLQLCGRHRSKSVDLFRQGRINLVLNSELDSAAAEHFQLHGPSVCAMALRVDDARARDGRAASLLCPDWQERIGEGERAHSRPARRPTAR